MDVEAELEGDKGGEDTNPMATSTRGDYEENLSSEEGQRFVDFSLFSRPWKLAQWIFV